MNIQNAIRFIGDWAGTSALTVTLVVAACSSAPTPPAQSDGQKQEAAGAGYKMDSALCFDKVKYPHAVDSDACVALVDKKWHRLADGGPDPVWFAADGGAR